MIKYISTIVAIFLMTTYFNRSSIKAGTHQTTADREGDRVVLTGDDLSSWRLDTGAWYVAGDVSLNAENNKQFVVAEGGEILVNGLDGNTSNILSKAEYGDVRAHIEFMVPNASNSGCYFMGRYEIQILDSYGVEAPQFLDCGGIYQRWDEKRDPKGYEGHPPRVNASYPPGEWQTFDVIFRAPRFNWWGKKVENARFEEVIHNGKTIHENVEVTGSTRAATYDDEKSRGPLMLQGDHGPVAYRNIWIMPLEGESSHD